MIKAVFLDIDNTLLDFDEYVREGMKDGFSKFEIGPYEPFMYDTFTRVNNRLWQELQYGTLDFETLKKIRWNLIFKELGISFDGPTFEKYFRFRLNESAIPVAGATDLLRTLHDKYILCAASNGPYHQQMNRLHIARMDNYLDYMFISEDIGFSKPSGEFFAASFERLNQKRACPVLPWETVMVGDSLTADMAGGIDYGMKTCFFNKYKEKIETDLPLDCIADSLDAIPSLLEKM